MKEIIKQKAETFIRTLNALPELRYLGDSILRTPTKDVSIKEGIEIADALNKTLLRYRAITGAGRGLAAPQIGIASSVFVTFLNDEHQVYINPKIVTTSDNTNLYRELCISSGLMSADVRRPETVTMEWYDQDGSKKERLFEGMEARLVQHEYDHLLGIPNLDKAEPQSIEFVVRDPLKQELRP